MSFFIAGTIATVSVAGSVMASNSANAQEEALQQNAIRRYALKSGIADQQYDEQDSLAMMELTEVSRQMLQAKGTLKASQAESGVSGNLQKRKQAILTTKGDEAKGKIVRNRNTNKINIATDLLGAKVDTEAQIAESKAREQSPLAIGINALSAGISGFGAGYKLSSNISSAVDSTTNIDTSGLKNIDLRLQGYSGR